MSDLRRLAEDDPQFADFVTAARRLRPRPEALQGLLQKLPPEAVPGVSAPDRAMSKLRRWGPLVGAAACALVAAAALDRSRESVPSAPPARLEAPASLETGTNTPDRSSRDDARHEHETEAPDLDGDALPSVHVGDLPIARGPEPRRRRQASGAPSAPTKSLGLEIELISAARDALTKGDPAGSIVILRKHEAEFPNGQFALEARAMRVEAAAARGDRSLARELAREFLANHPRSPYEERMRSLLSSMESK